VRDDTHAELANWGRWARAGAIPDLAIVEPLIFQFWRAGSDWDEGWGDQEAMPQSIPPPIDEHQAHATDAKLMRLRRRHWRAIRRHYYLGVFVERDKLDEAARAFDDLSAKTT
jgi:hypothetical protein